MGELGRSRGRNEKEGGWFEGKLLVVTSKHGRSQLSGSSYESLVDRDFQQIAVW